MGCLFFCFTPSFIFSFSPFESLLFVLLLFCRRCLPGPADLRSPPHTHASLIQEMKTECRRKEEEERQVVQTLEEEKEGLASRCAALRADLEERQRQANSQQDQRDAAQARLKV